MLSSTGLPIGFGQRIAACSSPDEPARASAPPAALAAAVCVTPKAEEACGINAARAATLNVDIVFKNSRLLFIRPRFEKSRRGRRAALRAKSRRCVRHL
jgi:hypothetical protein